jgi:hypothetical protein
MAKHSADRPRGVVGETDPNKIKKDLAKIDAANAKAMDKIRKGK